MKRSKSLLSGIAVLSTVPANSYNIRSHLNSPMTIQDKNTEAEAELQRLKLDVDVRMELDTIETLHTMILEGLGVCIMPLSAVRPYLKNKLYVVPFSPNKIRRTIGLIQKKNHHRQALLDKVHEVLASSAKKYRSMDL